MDQSLSQAADTIISQFEKPEVAVHGRKISVNPIISRVASWYEKLRTAMDYREEEVILRGAIERILKRRIILGGNPKTIAEPLVRELVWARYFPDESLSESIIIKVENCISLYLRLRDQITQKNPTFSQNILNSWIYNLMSSELEHTIGNRRKKEIMTNFMFNVLKDNITIVDESQQNRDVQVFIAVHKSFARDDLALLRYHLFKQYFGGLTETSLEQISSSFLEGYNEMQSQLDYPRKDKILNYVKDKTAVFFILDDLLNIHGQNIREIIKDENQLTKIVFEICRLRYNGIASKVRRAIVRSIIFILLTKAFFAIGIEGSYERIVYGQILWTSTLINIGVPPLIMAFVSLFIKTPGKDNSERIFKYIKSLLTESETKFKNPLIIKKTKDKDTSLLHLVFTVLWFASFILVFGTILYFLMKLHFNLLSMGVFVFFLAVISFLSYRINQSANIYSTEPKKTLVAPIADFLFLPFVRVGRYLTEGISQLNLLLFVFDFIIEMPFKGIFGFFEQWFLFLQTKREELE